MIGYWCAHYRELHSFVVSSEGRARRVLGRQGGKRRRKGNRSIALLLRVEDRSLASSLDPWSKKRKKGETGRLDALQVWWTIRRWLCTKSATFPSTRSCRRVGRFYLSSLDTRTSLSIGYLDVHKFVHGDAFTGAQKKRVYLTCVKYRDSLWKEAHAAKSILNSVISALENFAKIWTEACANSRLTCYVNINSETLSAATSCPFISCFIRNSTVCRYTSSIKRKRSYRETRYNTDLTIRAHCLNSMFGYIMRFLVFLIWLII